jgi:hypothetical protein
MKLNVNWMSNPQYLAQVGHFFGASSLILAVHLYSYAHHGGLRLPLYVYGIGSCLAAAKEFWFDIVFEKDSWADSAVDFFFYVLGGFAALMMATYVEGGFSHA